MSVEAGKGENHVADKCWFVDPDLGPWTRRAEPEPTHGEQHELRGEGNSFST